MIENVVVFSRQEITWLRNRFVLAKKHAEAIIENASSSPPTTDMGKLEFKKAQENLQMLVKQANDIEDLIMDGMTKLGSLNAHREQLEDSMSLAEEPHIQEKIKTELASLPKEEEYRVKMNRHSIKFILSIVEVALDNIKVIIPEYEKRPMEHFETKECPMSRSYYINKHLRTKTMLEQIRTRLEKRL